MKVKVSEATNIQLDWMVAKSEGMPSDMLKAIDEGCWIYKGSRRYTTEWPRGGPIIEREKIELIPPREEGDKEWMALWCEVRDIEESGIQTGPTPLIAAMRCFIASKLGEEVEVPEELT